MPGGGRITVETANVDARPRRGRPGPTPGDYVVRRRQRHRRGHGRRRPRPRVRALLHHQGVGQGTGLACPGLRLRPPERRRRRGRQRAGKGADGDHAAALHRGATARRPAGPRHGRPTRSGPALKVLLVEDDAEVGDLVEAMLHELGHKVVRADTATRRSRSPRREPQIGLVLTDVIMPGGKTGVDLARGGDAPARPAGHAESGLHRRGAGATADGALAAAAQALLRRTNWPRPSRGAERAAAPRGLTAQIRG